MERMTEVRKGKNVLPLKSGGMTKWSVSGDKAGERFLYGDAVDRLAAYEDMGLTPEQLKEVDKMYTELGREVMKYREAGTVEECGEACSRRKGMKVAIPMSIYSYGACPVCGREQTNKDSFCAACGQKLDWEG